MAPEKRPNGGTDQQVELSRFQTGLAFEASAHVVRVGVPSSVLSLPNFRSVLKSLGVARA